MMILHTNFEIFDDSTHYYWPIYKNICKEDKIIAYTHDDFQF